MNTSMRARLPGLSSTAATEPTHIAELALWAATADGALDRTEIDELVQMLQHVPGLERFEVRAADDMVEAMASTYVTEEAIAARVAEISSAIRTPTARRTAYQLALWSAARDGQFSEEESAFLQQLQELLELTDAEADALLRETIE